MVCQFESKDSAVCNLVSSNQNLRDVEALRVVAVNTVLQDMPNAVAQLLKKTA